MNEGFDLVGTTMRLNIPRSNLIGPSACHEGLKCARARIPIRGTRTTASMYYHVPHFDTGRWRIKEVVFDFEDLEGHVRFEPVNQKTTLQYSGFEVDLSAEPPRLVLIDDRPYGQRPGEGNRWGRKDLERVRAIAGAR